MLKVIGRVRTEIARQCQPQLITLEVIHRVVIGVTAIDRIEYVPFDVPSDNPFVGRYRLRKERPAAYADEQLVAEIAYASHLPELVRRYVVSKELCHALDESARARALDEAAIDNLVENFSLRSAAARVKSLQPNVVAEYNAEIAALELFCPVPYRRSLAATPGFDPIRVGCEHGIPEGLCELAFDEHTFEVIESLL